MALFTKSLEHLNGWTHQPEARGDNGPLRLWYAGHDGEMLGFTLSGSIRNCQSFYQQAIVKGYPLCLKPQRNKPTVKAMSSYIRDQAAGNFSNGSYGGPRVKGGR